MEKLRVKDRCSSQFRIIFWLTLLEIVALVLIFVCLGMGLSGYTIIFAIIFSLCFVFNEVSIYLTRENYWAFDNDKNIIWIKKIGFYPLVNWSLLYFIFVIRENFKKEMRNFTKEIRVIEK